MRSDSAARLWSRPSGLHRRPSELYGRPSSACGRPYRPQSRPYRPQRRPHRLQRRPFSRHVALPITNPGSASDQNSCGRIGLQFKISGKAENQAVQWQTPLQREAPRVATSSVSYRKSEYQHQRQTKYQPKPLENTEKPIPNQLRNMRDIPTFYRIHSPLYIS